MSEQEFLLPSALIVLYSYHCNTGCVFSFHELYVQRKEETLEMKLGIFSVLSEFYLQLKFRL